MIRKRRVLAVASNGGHWTQLWRMRPAWNDCQVCYITTTAGYERVVHNDAVKRGQTPPQLMTVPDANRWQKVRLTLQMLKLLVLVIYFRPDIVISTGASPGLFALMFGRLLRAKTIWIDSIANAETVSLSGQKAHRFADLWLTQWEDIAGPDGPYFKGSVI